LFHALFTPFTQERAQYADVAGKVNKDNVIGHLPLVIGHWSLVIGHWLLAKSGCCKGQVTND
jgi:hypothetical protein